MQFLMKKTKAAPYERTQSLSPVKAYRETLFVECVNLTKDYMLGTIIDKRPLFEWYAEHLGKQHTKSIITKDKYSQALIEKELQRLDLCNSVLLYTNLSDEETERSQTPFRGDM